MICFYVDPLCLCKGNRLFSNEFFLRQRIKRDPRAGDAQGTPIYSKLREEHTSIQINNMLGIDRRTSMDGKLAGNHTIYKGASAR